MFYHGSKSKGIKILHPSMSLHGKNYVYLTDNITVALIYTVNAIERYHQEQGLTCTEAFQPWYSYGFDKDGIPFIEEYYPNAFQETYQGQSGYIYECKEPREYSNPTNIYCAFVTEEKVETTKEIYISDVYQEMQRMISEGKLRLRNYEQLRGSYLSKIHDMIKEDIIKYDLLNKADNNYTVFLKAKFPELF